MNRSAALRIAIAGTIAFNAPFHLAAEAPSDFRRHVQIELAVDAVGNVAGRGDLSLLGDHTLFGRALGVDVSQRHAAWMRWLERAFDGSRIEGFELEESAGEQIVLRWRMSRKPELATGDRTEVMVALPVLPAVGSAEPAADRAIPVHLPFVKSDELEVVVTWDGEWIPDRLPAGVDVSTSAGHLNARRILDSPVGRLVYRRTLTLADRDVPADTVGPMRDLLAAMRNIDSQSLVLVRRGLRP